MAVTLDIRFGDWPSETASGIAVLHSTPPAGAELTRLHSASCAPAYGANTNIEPDPHSQGSRVEVLLQFQLRTIPAAEVGVLESRRQFIAAEQIPGVAGNPRLQHRLQHATSEGIGIARLRRE
jgi:hypothetical protein